MLVSLWFYFKNKLPVPDVMLIDGGLILCQVSKQAAGNTEDLHTASIDNKLPKYTASKRIIM